MFFIVILGGVKAGRKSVQSNSEQINQTFVNLPLNLDYQNFSSLNAELKNEICDDKMLIHPMLKVTNNYISKFNINSNLADLQRQKQKYEEAIALTQQLQFALTSFMTEKIEMYQMTPMHMDIVKKSVGKENPFEDDFYKRLVWNHHLIRISIETRTNIESIYSQYEDSATLIGKNAGTFVDWNKERSYKHQFVGHNKDGTLFTDYNYWLKRIEMEKIEEFANNFEIENIIQEVIDHELLESEGAVFLCDFYQSLLMGLGVMIVEESVQNIELEDQYKKVLEYSFIFDKLQNNQSSSCKGMMNPLDFYIRVVLQTDFATLQKHKQKQGEIYNFLYKTYKNEPLIASNHKKYMYLQELDHFILQIIDGDKEHIDYDPSSFRNIYQKFYHIDNKRFDDIIKISIVYINQLREKYDLGKKNLKKGNEDQEKQLRDLYSFYYLIFCEIRHNGFYNLKNEKIPSSVIDIEKRQIEIIKKLPINEPEDDIYEDIPYDLTLKIIIDTIEDIMKDEPIPEKKKVIDNIGEKIIEMKPIINPLPVEIAEIVNKNSDDTLIGFIKNPNPNPNPEDEDEYFKKIMDKDNIGKIIEIVHRRENQDFDEDTHKKYIDIILKIILKYSEDPDFKKKNLDAYTYLIKLIKSQLDNESTEAVIFLDFLEYYKQHDIFEMVDEFDEEYTFTTDHGYEMDQSTYYNYLMEQQIYFNYLVLIEKNFPVKFDVEGKSHICQNLNFREIVKSGIIPEECEEFINDFFSEILSNHAVYEQEQYGDGFNLKKLKALVYRGEFLVNFERFFFMNKALVFFKYFIQVEGEDKHEQYVGIFARIYKFLMIQTMRPKFTLANQDIWKFVFDQLLYCMDDLESGENNHNMNGDESVDKYKYCGFDYRELNEMYYFLKFNKSINNNDIEVFVDSINTEHGDPLNANYNHIYSYMYASSQGNEFECKNQDILEQINNISNQEDMMKIKLIERCKETENDHKNFKHFCMSSNQIEKIYIIMSNGNDEESIINIIQEQKTMKHFTIMMNVIEFFKANDVERDDNKWETFLETYDKIIINISEQERLKKFKSDAIKMKLKENLPALQTQNLEQLLQINSNTEIIESNNSIKTLFDDMKMKEDEFIHYLKLKFNHTTHNTNEKMLIKGINENILSDDENTSKFLHLSNIRKYLKNKRMKLKSTLNYQLDRKRDANTKVGRVNKKRHYGIRSKSDNSADESIEMFENNYAVLLLLWSAQTDAEYKRIFNHMKSHLFLIQTLGIDQSKQVVEKFFTSKQYKKMQGGAKKSRAHRRSKNVEVDNTNLVVSFSFSKKLLELFIAGYTKISRTAPTKLNYSEKKIEKITSFTRRIKVQDGKAKVMMAKINKFGLNINKTNFTESNISNDAKNQQIRYKEEQGNGEHIVQLNIENIASEKYSKEIMNNFKQLIKEESLNNTSEMTSPERQHSTRTTYGSTIKTSAIRKSPSKKSSSNKYSIRKQGENILL